MLAGQAATGRAARSAGPAKGPASGRPALTDVHGTVVKALPAWRVGLTRFK
jgi:hypothetical protein